MHNLMIQLSLLKTHEKIQALSRRYCGRCSAIQLAQRRILKYLDPDSHLPYWVHPSTGVVSWTKPKILGNEDVEHATMVATSGTEYLVRESEKWD